MYKLLGKSKEEPTILVALEQLNEKLEELEKKEKVLLKKVSEEVEKAKEFTRAKNKRAAIQCLKRKKLYEQQIEKYGGFPASHSRSGFLFISDLLVWCYVKLCVVHQITCRIFKCVDDNAGRKIDDVDKMMDEINEQNEIIIQIQDALATPIGSAANFDEVPSLSLIMISICYAA
ncbi:Vacuolar protein sorting-associated protein 32 -like protein 2 [Capsicum annuum]|uniref:Vacuolar protein sorting-associated protein 32 -like protein 2 n=1 Tax=Capsicum annuum TaxID=4072 RepID=A0A2G2YV91_CAPAN|nr:Vacuolar protein sorting-associated protein 32 -like protein 2 [Capsicum annuum]